VLYFLEVLFCTMPKVVEGVRYVLELLEVMRCVRWR
jgi:hypothetical protein